MSPIPIHSSLAPDDYNQTAPCYCCGAPACCGVIERNCSCHECGLMEFEKANVREQVEEPMFHHMRSLLGLPSIPMPCIILYLLGGSTCPN